MMNAFAARFSFALLVPTTFLTVGLTAAAVRAQNELYNPIPIPERNQVSDTLTDQDIPTGEGGFARDYTIELSAGDQVAIDLISDSFDTIVTLLASDGSTIAENDDGPDGTTNSLLFSRITETGTYIIRVRAFGETGGGPFTLKVTRLRPI
ncbi:PPC domain-containing protein [Coleofasciculus chthonoplastes]|uniref:Bacterial pre-peptidase C-terminal domain family n=1 Tax=Coleofasciculus chthonoplastes PCC 7420 TaxID=118168 RepID=B4VRJ8_9CYAN|nr:PPC domain-containing protein [Coleofasciculus chthonoplastes]EDX75429.1 Bacterial pre-peptidase C-terminal domain family [Coleofasciculus chthonoplastes PCC 7420]